MAVSAGSRGKECTAGDDNDRDTNGKAEDRRRVTVTVMRTRGVEIPEQ